MPATTAGGHAVGQRDAVVFLTTVVIVVTLAVLGPTLPAVVRGARFPEDTDKTAELALARCRMNGAAMDALASGRGQRTRHLDLVETRGVAVADYDHDARPDLAAFSYSGDGVYQTEARLGSAETGLADATAGTSTKYTVYAYQRSPVRLPRSGLPRFYPECGKARAQG
ncbi:hypothetical protein ACGFZQ_23590 [Streptomyces sp. NPDC048254]|uniref:hypothetical protein n=1 Tax=Streptomyces sp. NPDC048254 TaxID=3365525 RepID=UPI0037173161